LAGQGLSLLAIAALLVVSALVSGSETAMFSLTGYERLQLRQGSARLGRLVDHLLAGPRSLLLTILLMNLAVNLLIFTISSVVVYRLTRQGHPLAASVVAVATLFAIVLFAEILPKAVAYYLRVWFSQVLAMPLWIMSMGLWPIISVVRRLIVDPAVSILAGPVRGGGVQKEELFELLAGFSREELIESDQVDLLKNVIELKDVRVRQIMQPRVDLVRFDIAGSIEDLAAVIHARHPVLVPVYRENVDNIVGIIRSRRFGLRRPERISDVLEPVTFVPEQQRVDQLIHFFRQRNTNAAIVVDEYGGLTGLVRMANVVEEVLGESGVHEALSDRPQLRMIRPGCYLADASLGLDTLSERFDVPAPQLGVETVGGLVMTLVGHLPTMGERVEYRHLVLEARMVSGSKIEQVMIIDRRNTGG